MRLTGSGARSGLIRPRPLLALICGALLVSASPVAHAEDSAGQVAAGASPPPPPMRILFIGNSLTANHDIPLLVQALARAGGAELRVSARLRPNAALEDHWNDGAARLLEPGRWDLVVLQQGPSTRDESRAHLRRWTEVWSEAAREAGIPVALYAVWPLASQPGGFAAASRSYREAAAASGARLFAVGDAWERALAEDGSPPLALHAPDGLHASPEGAYLAALVIAHAIAGIDPRTAPAQLALPGGRRFEVATEVAARLRRAALGTARSEDAGGYFPRRAVGSRAKAGCSTWSPKSSSGTSPLTISATARRVASL